MDYGDIFKSGIGAIIGFSLAQLVNVVKLFLVWLNRPQLQIKLIEENGLILSHYDQDEFFNSLKEEMYGFDLQNVGRGIATGVRFQLIKIEIRQSTDSEFSDVSNHAFDLTVYKGEGRISTDTKIVLVPNASVLVHVAGWREDYNVVFPHVSGKPHYYEEMCSGAREYRFTVVAFDDYSRYVKEILTIIRHKKKAIKTEDKSSTKPATKDSKN